jgi:ABC-type nickel/cobalt efflux system permease component RcnA
MLLKLFVITLSCTAILTRKLKRERRTARRLQDQIENVGLRHQSRSTPMSLLPQSQQQTHHTEHAHNSEEDACLKQAQEDLKKLNGEDDTSRKLNNYNYLI